jgi:hypothetical protein
MIFFFNINTQVKKQIFIINLGYFILILLWLFIKENQKLKPYINMLLDKKIQIKVYYLTYFMIMQIKIILNCFEFQL